MKKQDLTSKENDVLTTSAISQDEIVELSHEDVSQEIDYNLVSSGPLYFDPRHIAPGYVPAFVSDKPGEIEMYKRWGYVVVTDKFRVGDDVASKTTRFGSAVTVQSKCGQLLVLMAISELQHKKLMAFRDGKNKERDAAMLGGKIEGVSDHYQSHNGDPMGGYTITKK